MSAKHCIFVGFVGGLDSVRQQLFTLTGSIKHGHDRLH